MDDDTRLKALLRPPERSHKDWPQVIHSLRQMQPILVQLVAHEIEVDWLARAVTILIEDYGPVDPPIDLLPKHGYITQSPIFAALAAQPHDGVQSDLVRALQGCLLVTAAMREHYVVADDCRSSLQKAGLAVRKIASDGLHDHLVRSICNKKSVQELNDLFESWLEPEHSTEEPGGSGSRNEELVVLTADERTRIAPVSVLVADAQRNRPPRIRARRESEKPWKKSTTRIECADVDHGPGGSRRFLVIASKLDEAEQKERHTEGLPPLDEFAPRAAYAESLSSRNRRYPADRLTENQANRRIILKARGFKTSQQWSPNRNEILHPPALQALLNPGKSTDEKYLSRWQILALMLFTGCELKAIQAFRVWATLEDWYENIGGMGIIGETGTLVMPAYDLPQAWKPESALSTFFNRPDRKIEQYLRCPKRHIMLRFPDYFSVGDALLQRARVQGGTQRLFPDFKKSHLKGGQEQLSKHVKALNEKFQSTLTLLRISRHLANSVYGLSGDFAEALSLSHQHHESNDPRLYYYAPSVGHLARQYDRVWFPLASMVNGGSPPETDYSWLDEDYAGSAAVALTAQVRSEVFTMVSRLRGHMASKGRRSRDSSCLIHNLLTGYVIRQIQWMTGIRAVRDPIELHNYDPNTGFMMINDKDSADKYGARVVWLLPQVQRQVKAYLQQVAQVAKARSKSTAELAFRFLAPDGQMLGVSLKTLHRFTITEYPYAPNAHRHYQRTRLRELDVDAGYVDAWLGHGGIGRESYSRHSAISPQAVRLALTPALEIIWEELGWEMLPNSH